MHHQRIASPAKGVFGLSVELERNAALCEKFSCKSVFGLSAVAVLGHGTSSARYFRYLSSAFAFLGVNLGLFFVRVEIEKA